MAGDDQRIPQSAYPPRVVPEADLLEERDTDSGIQAQGTEAITGVSSEGYSGKGMVQSPSRPEVLEASDDD